MKNRYAACKLCGANHSSREPHVLVGGPAPSKAVVALAQSVTVATGPMTHAEAVELTNRIRRTRDEWLRLVYEAHEREAWKAMRYGSWTDYVAGELPMSKSRAYQLIAHAKITLALGIGDGVHSVEPPTEGQTRNLSSQARERITKAATVDPEAGRNQLAVEIARDPGVTRAKAAEPGHYPGTCEHLFRCVKCGAE